MWCRSQSRAPFSQDVDSAVCPVDDVVDVAPGGRGAAAREHAVQVAELHGAADRGGSGPLCMADIQGKPVGTGDDPHHPGVAGQPAGGLGTDGPGERQLAARHPGRPALGAEGHEVDAHPDLRPLTADLGQRAGRQHLAAQLDEGVTLPLGVACGGRRRADGRSSPTPARCARSRRRPGRDGRTGRPGRRCDGASRKTRGSPAASSSSPVGVDPGDPPAHRLAGVLRAECAGRVGEHPVGDGNVDADLGGSCHAGRRDCLGDHAARARPRPRPHRMPRQAREGRRADDRRGRSAAASVPAMRQCPVSHAFIVTMPSVRCACPRLARRRPSGSAAPRAGSSLRCELWGSSSSSSSSAKSCGLELGRVERGELFAAPTPTPTSAPPPPAERVFEWMSEEYGRPRTESACVTRSVDNFVACGRSSRSVGPTSG